MIAEERSDLPIETSEEPITAWRCWFVLPNELLLRPIYKRGLAWKPRQAMEAVCPDQVHRVPAEACKCGIWAVCHSMLLNEVHWAATPQNGVEPIPGIVVVGQIAMWGNVIQHERGWRSSYAYPTHLYAFTDDAMISESLRERYGVPVTWGTEAEALRKILPRPRPTSPPASLSALSPAAQTVFALLSGPKWASGYLGELVKHSLAAHFLWWDRDPAKEESNLEIWREGVARYRASLVRARATGRYYTESPPFSGLRDRIRRERLWMLSQWARIRAIRHGDAVTARRIVWHELVTQRRHEVADLEQAIGRYETSAESYRQAIERGAVKRTGVRYTTSVLKAKHRQLAWANEWADKKRGELAALLQNQPIPTYREWCAMVRSFTPHRVRKV
jgi:hypothetical protein